MSLPLWGSLEKALDDGETIEQAIARLIDAHEADTEAHLGAGESLSAHKHESVIDHPAGSVVPDKNTFSDLQFTTEFESLDGFTITTHVTNTSYPGAIMSYYDGGGDIEYIKANMVGLIPDATLEKDFLIDTYFYLDSATTQGLVHVGSANNTLTTFYIGFKIDSGNIKGFATWGGVQYETPSLHTIVDTSLIFVRVFYDYGGGVIYFYVNGTQVATLQPTATVQCNNQFAIHADAQTEESAIMRIYRQTISVGL